MSELSPDTPINPAPKPGESFQQINLNTATARVPEHVAGGVFASNVMSLAGPQEFILDFIQGLAKPAQVTARVVLPHAVMERLVNALKEQYAAYCRAFGAPPPMPKPPGRPLSIEEVYQNVKVPEGVQSGAYANGFHITVSPAEWSLDFVTKFYPHSAVAARVHIAAARMPSMIDSLSGLVANMHRQRAAQQAQNSGMLPGGGPPPSDDPPAPPADPRLNNPGE